MNKFKKMLPAPRGRAAPAASDDFEKTAAALRKASGRDEYVIAPMRCARMDKPYRIQYVRKAGEKLLRIQEIVRENETVGSGAALVTQNQVRRGPLAVSKTADLSDFDPDEFNQAGRRCPWCRDTSTIVHCGKCNDTYCGGTVKENYYRCVERCGGHGFVKDYNIIHGNRKSSERQRTAIGKLVRPSKSALLQKGRLALPKKR